ncbi:YT521-B-like domain-containing protein [Trametes punicea]|nr:YT521-B-like domain-containing protein [Trametes punicea]
MSGDAPKPPALSMSDSRSTSSTSEQGRQSSRGRGGTPQYGASRHPPVRPSFQTSAGPLYPPPIPTSSQENWPTASAPAPSFQGPPPQYTYGQRGPYVGQYTITSQPPVSMVHHSPPQYAYPPPHPGLHAPDQSMLSPPHNQLLGYSPSTLMPMMQPHSPVYQYPGQSPESSSSSSRSFTTSPAVFSPHTRPQGHASPPPHSPLPPQTSGPPHAHSGTLPPPHSASFAGQTPYSPMRFSTPPFAYPPHSFAPSPSPYATSQYPSHYPQHYPQTNPEQEGQGTWWYLPSQPASGQYESFQSPYAMSYSPVNTREGESSQYRQQSSPAAPVFPMSPTRQSGSSSAPGSSPGGHVPYSPPFGAQQSQFSQPVQEQSPLLQRGRPPDPGPSTTSPVSSSSRPTEERPQPARARRPYHPNPPAHRSEWVMWTGNVPSDATHDELWRFFNSPPSPGSSVGPTSTQSAPAGPVASTTTASSSSSDSLYGGVSSIFLISRSNCAFVNFQSEAHLQAAIKHFNGLPLRPNDPRCPRLVCRVRAREDDLKAGVGGQRGVGIHVRWVRDKKEREREAARRRSMSSSEHVTSPSSSPTDPAHMIGSLSLSSDDEGGHGRRRKPEPHSSSSGSYASTNSSILTAYFPKRYFILKSLTQFDLDLSVEKGLWATQRHNEGILDQAYRTSKEVYLIFSVNKSGEFYGYAKMAGPIMRGEQRVSWASRTDSPPQRRSSTQSQRDSPSRSRGDRDPMYFSPSEQRYGESPFPMSPEQSKAPPPARPPSDTVERDILSAPAEMAQPHRGLSLGTEATQSAPSMSFDINAVRPVAPLIAGMSGRKQVSQPEQIELDRTAPIRAIRDPRAAEALRKSEEGSLHTVAEEDERGQAGQGRDKGKEVERRGEGEASEIPREEGPSWGEPFKVEWIRTDRLPFTRTRHLRNPWNHDREVKVSRDGTELEPSVGQALLEEWEKLDQAQAQPQPAASSVDVGRRLQGKASISADVLSAPSPSRSAQRKGKEGG